MYRFFDAVTRPLMEALSASVVVEIGSDRGHQTELVAPWCQEHGAVLHCVDPLPKYDVAEWQARWPESLRFHLDLSLNALVDIGPSDVVLIDGDHNWYTVHHELVVIEAQARAAGADMPLVLFHDVGWPYGRRDLYYDPSTIPGAYLHPHEQGGLDPDRRGLLDHGFNDHLHNALHEGTPRNGVRTAIEDFVADREGTELFVFPGIHGLGVLTTPGIRDALGSVWEKLTGGEGLRSVLEVVERDRLVQLQDVWRYQREAENFRRREDDAVEVARERQETIERLRGDKERLGSNLATAREERDELEKQAASAKARAEEAERDRTRTQERARAELRSMQERAAERFRQVDGERAALALERDQLRQDHDRLEQHRDELASANDELRREVDSKKARARRAEDAAGELRRRAQSAERDFARLRNRRGVRAALGLAQLVRPFFRLRRGQVGRSNGGASSMKARRSRSTSSDESRSGGPRTTDARPGDALVLSSGAKAGVFHGWISRLIEDGVPEEFTDAFRESEQASSRAEPDTRPLVSVVMATHDRADLLREAIPSVLEQRYPNWELLVCDDGSTDDTASVVASFGDERVRYLPADAQQGAASARNRGLAAMRGELVAYLDSDNLWHPSFLAEHVVALEEHHGQVMSYSKYVDIVLDGDDVILKKFRSLPFDYDELARKNFVDLNSLVHRRELYDVLGGFDEDLVRRQDWQLVLKYAFLRDPLYVDQFLTLYRRNQDWDQITLRHRDEDQSSVMIARAVDDYYANGLTVVEDAVPPSVTVISWDICRNHFSKAYNLAEAADRPGQVQLLGFRFFDEPIFQPYRDADPDFTTTYLPGGDFPGFADAMARAVANVRGDVVYAVKPRLPSLGVALLANYHHGTPVVVEMNDLESVVTSPKAGVEREFLSLGDVDPSDPDLENPYGQTWTALMEGLVRHIPLRATHNDNLDQVFGGGAFLMRNPKDDQHFAPHRYDRRAVREELGFGPDDRVLLFGGMVRRHKGVFEFEEVLERAGPNYRLLVVGSRETPDQKRLRQEAGDRITILDPVDRNRMAAINLASDSVVLWLDPDVAASHYQMPYKLTDALAMRVPVIANDIGDLGQLGRDGYLALAPFGDVGALVAKLHGLDDDVAATRDMTDRGRRLYLRQFSYAATRRNLELVTTRAAASPGVLPVAKDFAEFFDRFVSATRTAVGTKGVA